VVALSELLISDARYVMTVDDKRRIIRDGAIAIDGMEIVDVGKSSELKRKYPRAERIDAKDKLVMPGLFDCHAHSYQNMVRGMAFVLPRRERAGFVLGEGLRLWSVYSPEDAQVSMALNCLECIKNGIVGFCDWGINLRYGFDGLAEVVEKSGLRAVLGKSVMDRPRFGILENAIPEGLWEDKATSIKDSIRVIEKWNGKAEGRIKVWFGPRSVGALEVETYREIARLVKEYGIGITFHLAEEAEIDAGFVHREYGMSPMEFMKSVGWVGPNVDFVHCPWLTGIDLKILMETKTNVVHCPLGGLDTMVNYMLEMGVNVALGCDGGHQRNDIFEAMFAESLLKNREPRRDLTVLYPERIIEMATINGAKALMWEKETGSIERGKRADIILIDLKKPALVPVINPVLNVVYRTRGCDVNTVIVNGKVLMEDGVVRTLDESTILSEAQRRSEEVKERSKRKIEYYWPME